MFGNFLPLSLNRQLAVFTTFTFAAILLLTVLSAQPAACKPALNTQIPQILQTVSEQLPDEWHPSWMSSGEVKMLNPVQRLNARIDHNGVRLTAANVDQNMSNLNEVTLPLAKQSRSMVAKLDSTLGNLETVSAELSQFSRLLQKQDGSLQKFMTDPELYRNLNRSASSLAILLKNMEPIVSDLRVFSDKIARHPEVIGVRGALTRSSGLKDPPPREASRNGAPPGRNQFQRQ